MVASPFSRHMCLFGFDHDTQARLVFDNTWAASFLTRAYTDETHEYVRRFDADQHAKQGLKYGNNVFVLFKALLYCGKYWGQESFWGAIARGFSAKPVYVEELTYMLMEARKIKIQRTRSLGHHHNSEVTRAVDEWMAFLDAHGPDLEKVLRNRAVTDPRVYADADSFFKSMKGKNVNSNGIPMSAGIIQSQGLARDSVKSDRITTSLMNDRRRWGHDPVISGHRGNHMHPSLKWSQSGGEVWTIRYKWKS
ncbi:hypothetical protein N0V85_003928 [Neurospora sp. IMI 360204]|nr:hypothetical protein N0V85_003928 [Neurospora sp. IMI 360204]